MRARDHGVTPEFVKEIRGLGFAPAKLDEFVRLRDHGITPGFVNHAKARGAKPETVEDLVRLKNGGLWRKQILRIADSAGAQSHACPGGCAVAIIVSPSKWRGSSVGRAYD